MKRTIFALSALVFALSNTACSEDGLDDKSVITGIGYEIETPFDEWLLENFIEPYNIRVMYRYEDMESDMTYNLVPARYERSIEMAQLVSYLCLQAYDEITGSRDFIRANFPKDLFFVGSPAYNNNGSIVLGTAEGGAMSMLSTPPTSKRYITSSGISSIRKSLTRPISNRSSASRTEVSAMSAIPAGRYIPPRPALCRTGSSAVTPRLPTERSSWSSPRSTSPTRPKPGKRNCGRQARDAR